jgi:hypothetical protein
MTNYKITLYDTKTRKTSLLADIPERRSDPKRPKGKPTIYNWLKVCYGRRWFSQNRNLIGIIECRQREGGQTE